MAKKQDPKRVKISAGGPWDGDIWSPMPPTERQQAAAEEYGNTIRDESSIAGALYKGTAFGDKDVFFLVVEDDTRVMMPEHGGLMRDLELTFEKFGDGVSVEIEYKGTAKIKSGKWKEKDCHTYDVFKV